MFKASLVACSSVLQPEQIARQLAQIGSDSSEYETASDSSEYETETEQEEEVLNKYTAIQR